MQLQQYIDILWRRKWVLLFTIITTMIVVVGNTRAQTPMYRASTVIRIAASASSSASGSLSYSDYTYATQLMNTYVEIATSKPILDELKAQLNLKHLPALTAEVIPNTELVKITTESADPALAAKVANSMAELLIAESKELYSGSGISSQEILGVQLAKARTEFNQTRNTYARLIVQTPAATGEIESTRQLLQLNQNTYATLFGQFTQANLREEIRSNMVTVIEPALVPQVPFAPRTSLNYALGFAVGLMGGLGLVFLFENQDTSLYKSEDIEAIVELSALAKIPKANRTQLHTLQNDFSPLVDAFQSLALNLQPVNDQPLNKILLIMSAEPNQGKSMVVHRLALSLADLGKKVIVIDCDVRLPKMHTLFGLPNDCGLTDVLEQKKNLKEALQTSSFENVKLLASGMPSSHPTKLLGSHQMGSLLDGLKGEFDYVLLDSSALLAVSDIAAVVPNVDSVLLVARRGYAHRESLLSVKKILAGLRFRDKSINLIVNQAESGGGYSHYRYRRNLNARSKPSEITPVQLQN